MEELWFSFGPWCRFQAVSCPVCVSFICSSFGDSSPFSALFNIFNFFSCLPTSSVGFSAFLVELWSLFFPYCLQNWFEFFFLGTFCLLPLSLSCTILYYKSFLSHCTNSHVYSSFSITPSPDISSGYQKLEPHDGWHIGWFLLWHSFRMNIFMGRC